MALSVDTTLSHELDRAAHVLDLATSLLRYCRERRADLAASVHNEPLGRSRVQEVRKRARAYFRKDPDSIVDKSKRDLVSALLSSDDHPPWVGAWGLALELSGCYGESFLDEFLQRNAGRQWTAKPGDPLPIPHVRREAWREVVKEWDRARIAHGPPPTDPGRIVDPQFSQLPNLRLVPSLDDSWTITLDTRFSHELDLLWGENPITGHWDITVGTALLNYESRKQAEFDWDEDVDPSPRFFNVRPLDSEGQLERMSRVLERADAVADILIYPELCATEDGQRALVRAFRARRGSVQLLVAGSTHCKADGEGAGAGRWNKAVVAFRPHDRHYEHAKFRPFSYWNRPDGTSHEVEFLEAIDCRKEIRICLSKTWYLSVLICLDCLGPEILNLLNQFGVNLLLIPAHTEKLDVFGDLSPLVRWNQSVVVVANNPMTRLKGSGLRDGHALVMSPLDPRPNIYQYDGRSENLPRLLLFDLRGLVNQVRSL